MQKIRKVLEKKGIMYSQSYDGSQVTIGEYPKYIVVHMTDIDYFLPDYPHTGTFYYMVAWNDWKKSSTPKCDYANTPAEAMKIIKQAMCELGLSKNTVQETLFF